MGGAHGDPRSAPLHVSLATGGRLEQPVPPRWNAFTYVFSGGARVGREARLARSGELVVLDREGGPVVLAANADGGGAEVLLVAGEPIGEPLTRYGPFVMNTEQELVEAISDYHAGRMGAIVAEREAPPPR